MSGSQRIGRPAGHADYRIRAGYTAVKICPTEVTGFLGTPLGLQSIVDRVAAVREAIGASNDLAVDLHGRASIPLARQLLPVWRHTDGSFAEW